MPTNTVDRKIGFWDEIEKDDVLNQAGLGTLVSAIIAMMAELGEEEDSDQVWISHLEIKTQILQYFSLAADRMREVCAKAKQYNESPQEWDQKQKATLRNKLEAINILIKYIPFTLVKTMLRTYPEYLDDLKIIQETLKKLSQETEEATV